MEVQHSINIIERLRKSHPSLATQDAMGVHGIMPNHVAVDPNPANRDILVVATTDDLDLDEEIVLPGGADRTYIDVNRKVFLNHVTDEKECLVGEIRSLKAITTGGRQVGWQARVRIYEGPLYPAAELVWDLATKHGMGASIGFIARDHGRPNMEEAAMYPGAKSIVRLWKWIELSFVFTPCNVRCQTLAAPSLASFAKGADPARLTHKMAAALGIERPRPKKRIIFIGASHKLAPDESARV